MPCTLLCIITTIQFNKPVHQSAIARSVLILDSTHSRMVTYYRRFGTSYRSHLQGSCSPIRMPELIDCIAWPLEMEPIGCLETSVKTYQYTMSKIPKECVSPLSRGASLGSRSHGHRCNFANNSVGAKLTWVLGRWVLRPTKCRFFIFSVFTSHK
jgi:hypothetical protein